MEENFEININCDCHCNIANNNAKLSFPLFLTNLTIIILTKLCFIFVSNNFKEVLSDCDNGLYMKVHGMPVYQGIQSDPAWNNVFNKAMANICTIEMKKILEKYKGFEGISILVDVGGGIGQSLNMIISKYPSIKGINFDLPQVIQHAPIYPGISLSINMHLRIQVLCFLPISL